MRKTRCRQIDIDKIVGARIKEVRKTRSMSLTDMAELMDISGQQLAKYEKATNSISASRLYMISKILGMSVNFFYRDLDVPTGDTELHAAEVIELGHNFMLIKNHIHQEGVNSLVKALSKRY